MTTPDPALMSRQERTDLRDLARQRAALAKLGVSHRAAVVLADFEQQIATIYRFDDEAWADVTAAGDRAIKEAQAIITARCEQLGIPKECRPSIKAYWSSRGENAVNERRVELRRVATTRIAAVSAEAKLAIEAASLTIQSELLAGGLTSEAAHGFLAGMPTVEALMPMLTVDAIRALPVGKAGRR